MLGEKMNDFRMQNIEKFMFYLFIFWEGVSLTNNSTRFSFIWTMHLFEKRETTTQYEAEIKLLTGRDETLIFLLWHNVLVHTRVLCACVRIFACLYMCTAYFTVEFHVVVFHFTFYSLILVDFASNHLHMVVLFFRNFHCPIANFNIENSVD